MNNHDKTNIEKTLIREVAAILSVDSPGIDPTIPLHDIGMDSMGFVELLVFIEKHFNVNLMETGLTNDDFSSLTALAASIADKL